MGMLQCRDCRENVSSSSKTCIHCGARHPGRGKVAHVLNVVGNAVIALGVVFFVLSVVFGLVIG